MGKKEDAIRQSIIDHCRWMNDNGLNQGTSGNISVRHKDSILITPSGIPYETMTPDMIARMPLDRDYGSWEGPKRPSSEWRFHLDIQKARPDINAIVHTHSMYATILAMTRRDIPPCHYMIAAFGGPNIRCSGYARFGTPELSKLAVEALEDRMGCLLGSHGMIALGDTLEKAMWYAVELETIAKQYYHTLLIGGAVMMTDEQIAETAAGMKGYGLNAQDEAPKPVEVAKPAEAEKPAGAQKPTRKRAAPVKG